MTTVSLTSPYAMRAATLTIESDDFTAAVSAATFVPTKRQPWRGIGGNSIGADADWTLNVAFAQDLAPTGLLRYLLDHEGEEADVVLTPVDDGPAISATVVCSPGQVGGSRGDATIAVATAALESTKPLFTDPAP